MSEIKPTKPASKKAEQTARAVVAREDRVIRLTRELAEAKAAADVRGELQRASTVKLIADLTVKRDAMTVKIEALIDSIAGDETPAETEELELSMVFDTAAAE